MKLIKNQILMVLNIIVNVLKFNVNVYSNEDGLVLQNIY